ncbi:exosome complex component RRP40-like isoform X3 [Vespa mandarinia]|uniref:exosome complex component RRP40-like isoform X3 n=1 Tax=Vespa mandarinia TaxID=7446 RepID=UPI00160BC61B|nr:exosome complex component RRP40-like isoform X3 [Vespa mandarinia]
MEVNVDDVVMPGDIVKDIFKNDIKETVVLGPGLRREADTVFICKAGILKKRPPAVYYVNNYQKRYVPTRGENVIGIVIQKVGDIFKVDIGAKESAALSYLAFEGATKKNRPDIQVGDIVFAKLLVAIKDMEPELVCVDSQGKQKKLGVLSSDDYIKGRNRSVKPQCNNAQPSFIQPLCTKLPYLVIRASLKFIQ